MRLLWRKWDTCEDNMSVVWHLAVHRSQLSLLWLVWVKPDTPVCWLFGLDERFDSFIIGASKNWWPEADRFAKRIRSANDLELPSTRNAGIAGPRLRFGLYGKISRINVGCFMADLISDESVWNQWNGKMPVIYNREA